MKLIIIANRLPLKVSRNNNNDLEFVRSEGGLTTGLDSLEIDMEKHWVGWPGTIADSPEEEILIRDHLEALKFHPVFLSQEQIHDHYEGYSNSILWPLCHYFYSFIDYNTGYWNGYKEVNRIFCNVALGFIEPGDIVWVQDYQLMLLPQMLRESGTDMNIGYFHHIPFPTYELMRVLPQRAELVLGLLGADLIGFHTHDYMRHFVSACERILDFRFDLDQVSLENRIAYADVFPMGINYNVYHEAPLLPEIQQKVRELKDVFGDRKLILSVDRLDYSKGILSRIKGFKRFLELHPEYHEKVSLVMIVVPSRDTVDSYFDLKTKIDESIGAINGRYSSINWTPLYYFYHSFDFNELIAMYHIADVALITPLRDGMNLVAKEYVAAKRDKPGVLILSEMAGAAVELNDALIINPNDTDRIADSICEALEMPEEEQLTCLQHMQRKVAKYTVNYWANNFINQLLSIRENFDNVNSEQVDEIIISNIKSAYHSSNKRLIILDYDGTLSPFRKKPEEASPDAAILNVLKDLVADTRNNVVISSGRDHQILEKWFGEMKISMAAEHGAYYKNASGWQHNLPDTKPWNDEITDILHLFVEKTPRSMLEEKKTTLVWHYRNVDAWLASLREQQLINALIEPCSRLGLQIMRGNKIVEIKSPSHTKGSEAKRLMKLDNYDFIMAIGDDTTDEDMFKALPETAYTIKIGKMSQVARYNLRSQSKTLPFLRRLMMPD
ncbi:MAG: bifunctional alpha,alpha-trehalose-phosphate synthase (UDP-forming)/trehalose-phosphatase [Paludibacter sp.]|nr:bifunctional alpha,alpha-trehalose-phosphate synthase (UDP-forming)/trehalose-phosphatase [Paludibacter sp.]MDD4198524.1 bifunctional alpha,alpha-trehalose-phosphate synthase (UDP-forming)/trehalose-phosphatase [Paludibacter sp.]MDD4427994.1 bifunctional alpha,alpha-trehalose-phosphate synthase (UDP-forming)/trehalose-phosphatase [Paludibacter sp.]